MNDRLLDTIHSPKDIKEFSVPKMNTLSAEIREELIRTVSKTGGHLASNLGVVELTIALHKVFDTPQDQIVWDVGHQSYTHKILTGRLERFPTLRQENGLAGFPKTTESPHDAFIAGHSSTSISVANGLAMAKYLNNDPGYVIAVIGDGAFTGGMAYEGLNNGARKTNNVIVILNDNDMSISKNVGALAKYLAVIRSKPEYFKVKDAVRKAVKAVPLIGKPIYNGISNSKALFKQALYHSSNMFENFGYKYFGPIDGHNIENLCEVLERAKSLHRPTLIHINTKKGQGYSFAEQNPDAFHGISKFNIETGHPDSVAADSFSSVFGEELVALAREDKRICAITAAMGHGTGLKKFEEEFKPQNRYLDVGIAEGHAVTYGAALSANGIIPVFAVYSTFLQRAYDQLIHDASIEKRHLVLAIDRAGIVGDDGETHQGMFDVAMLSAIPGVTIYSPSDYSTQRKCLKEAIYDYDGVVAVRYPRGAEAAVNPLYADGNTSYSYFQSISSTLVITYGRIFAEAAMARDFLRLQNKNISLLKLTKIMPIEEEILAIAMDYEDILFVEEGIKTGSIGEHFICRLMECGYHGNIRLKAIDNQFVEQAPVPVALKKLGLDCQSIINMVLGE